MARLKGELQADNGDVLYPHTSSDVVFTSAGKTVTKELEEVKKSIESVDVSWDGITGKPPTFPPSPHTDHSEINTGLIKGKALTTNNKQLINHTSDAVYVGNPTVALSLESKDEIRANIGGKVKTVLHNESVINADTVDGKHAIDFPLKSQGIGGNAPVWAGSNLNDIPIGTYTTLSTGVPVTGEYFLVTTRYNDTGKIKEQYALRQANGERYFRWFNGTAWSSWRNLDDYAPSYKSANGYWGICPVKGNDTGWIRTPSLGLLPYASGGGASAGSLGTLSWKFKEIHGVDIFANGVNVGTEINNLKSIVNNPKVVKSVQRGLLNSSVKGSKENGIYYQDVTIASVVMTKALVLVTSTDAKSANARLVNATTLRIYSGAQYGGDSFDATNCNWQVIEFY